MQPCADSKAASNFDAVRLANDSDMLAVWSAEREQQHPGRRCRQTNPIAQPRRSAIPAPATQVRG